MHNIFLFFLYVMVYLLGGTFAERAKGMMIGAILECSSRVGKEEGISMEMAIQHLNNQRHQNLILRSKCSHAQPLHAAQAARHLIRKFKVQAIVGPNSWEESSAVAEAAHQFNVPILSLSDTSPTQRWPWLIQASPSTSSQSKALAAILNSCHWSRLNLIYQDTESFSHHILNHLYPALHHSQVQVSGLLPLPRHTSFHTIRAQLEKLRRGQCRVFVVHAGLDLTQRVLHTAKEMKMMETGYVWITTDAATSMAHSLNASIMSDMQGVLGVRRYFPDRGNHFDRFSAEFTRIFRRRFPDEKNHDPGISALQAYDVVWAVGSAMMNGGDRELLLQQIVATDFEGLSGRVHFYNRELPPVREFQIINVIGKSYLELGLWSDGLGFSRVKGGEHNVSMEILGHVYWPGGPVSKPRGWELPTIWDPLIIGVPNTSITNKFVNVEYDPNTKNYEFSGFSIEVFNRTVQQLNYALPYKLVAHNGTYTELVKKVEQKELDAAVGDIAIISKRYEYVEFSHAHTESGLVMVVPILKHSNKTWLFMKPFTKAMWLLTVFVNVYNGFVIWSIEKEYCADLKGPLLHQIGTLIWLAFATLFSLHGERLHSNLSKMATVVWLFVALIITQSYTASLTSMLTLQNIEPKIANIETLKSENALVGCSKASFVREYLRDALKFDENNIKNFTKPEDYAAALRSGDISAAFLEVPVSKLFVAKYCKSFTTAGPTYKIGGYGFAFPKGSVLLPDVDEALLNVFESGELKDLEKSLIASEKCVDIQVDNDTPSLSPHSFLMLFIFTGGTSTVVLAIYYFRSRWKVVKRSTSQHHPIWIFIWFVLMKWKIRANRISPDASRIQNPTNSNNPYSQPRMGSN